MSTTSVTTTVQLSISQPDADDVKAFWRKDNPELLALALVDVAPGVTLHLHDDVRDRPYLDKLIATLSEVRDHMSERSRDQGA
ncbi:hypothetical protein A6A08_02125 [Nocardiopsis sp. TSRI0078]|uniref:hypothetical protein n=1 Tax=unclassified Nocardiopsis TaxID=2649073 RepID=UPI00093C7A38|nr:hypothetical protein [Nocardiopsis sp. TSRI0078]OKI23592.1 hypothetical protein A6A08_02125 [Nocardiopsis sp. TSRI0078]